VIDKGSINSRLSKIEQSLKVLEKVRKAGFSKYNSDFETQLKAERALHISIEASIDIANHLIAVKKTKGLC